MWTTLAPADPHEDEEEEDSQEHQADKHPLCRNTEKFTLEMAHLQDRTRSERRQGRTWGRKQVFLGNTAPKHQRSSKCEKHFKEGGKREDGYLGLELGAQNHQHKTVGDIRVPY